MQWNLSTNGKILRYLRPIISFWSPRKLQRPRQFSAEDFSSLSSKAFIPTEPMGLEKLPFPQYLNTPSAGYFPTQGVIENSGL